MTPPNWFKPQGQNDFLTEKPYVLQQINFYCNILHNSQKLEKVVCNRIELYGN